MSRNRHKKFLSRAGMLTAFMSAPIRPTGHLTMRMVKKTHPVKKYAHLATRPPAANASFSSPALPPRTPAFFLSKFLRPHP
jgi:hypothetical protein